MNSLRGTQFRQWATHILREHLVKGYTFNEQRLREEQAKFKDMQRTVELLALKNTGESGAGDQSRSRGVAGHHRLRLRPGDPRPLRGKRKDVSAARGALCYVAVVKMGMSGASVARMLNISRAEVSLAARRGKEIYQRSKELQTVVFGLQR